MSLLDKTNAHAELATVPFDAAEARIGEFVETPVMCQIQAGAPAGAVVATTGEPEPIDS